MSNEKERFKVGDVVINLEHVELWDNVYHFKKFIQTLKDKEVVMQVSNSRFATLDSFDIDIYSDRENYKNQRNIFYCQNGDSVAGFKKMQNWTTNEKNIRAYFQKKFSEAILKCDEADEIEIAELEEKIRHAQEKIANIKAGKRTLSYNSSIIERDFINSQIDEINTILNSFNS